jgi:hypothetical protein
MKKFETREKYRESMWKGAEELSAFECKERTALEEVQALKAEYSKKVEESVAAGIDATAELDDLDDRIEKAERAHARRKHECQLKRAAGPSVTVTREDVVTSWNDEFVPQFIAEILEPLSKALKEAKDAYVAAFVALRKAQKHFENEKKTTIETIDPANTLSKYAYSMKGAGDIPRSILVSAQDVRDLLDDKIPEGVTLPE